MAFDALQVLVTVIYQILHLFLLAVDEKCNLTLQLLLKRTAASDTQSFFHFGLILVDLFLLLCQHRLIIELHLGEFQDSPLSWSNHLLEVMPILLLKLKPLVLSLINFRELKLLLNDSKPLLIGFTFFFVAGDEGLNVLAGFPGLLFGTHQDSYICCLFLRILL